MHHQIIKYQLTHQPACYDFLKTKKSTFVIPTGENQFVQVNNFNIAPVKWIALALVTSSWITRHIQIHQTSSETQLPGIFFCVSENFVCFLNYFLWFFHWNIGIGKQVSYISWSTSPINFFYSKWRKQREN